VIEISKKEIHFIGILANVDDSILNIKLDHGFEIFELSTSNDDDLELISILKDQDSANYDVPRWPFSNGKIYYIHDSFWADDNDFSDNTGKFHQKQIEFFAITINYIYRVIRLMKLFKEGNVSLSDSYLYYAEKGSLKLLKKSINSQEIFENPYKIEEHEITDLQNFIQTTNLHIEEKFLKLSIKNFELSYTIFNHHMYFLSLMNGLEGLLHPAGQGEIRYKISRYVAVLLGKDKRDSENIFHAMNNYTINVQKLFIQEVKSYLRVMGLN